MLNVNHLDTEIAAHVTVDEYVPITVESPDGESTKKADMSAPTIYWRANGARTLVEIGMEDRACFRFQQLVHGINRVNVVEGVARRPM